MCCSATCTSVGCMKSLAFLSEAAFGERPVWTDDVISYCLMLRPVPFCEKTADKLMRRHRDFGEISPTGAELPPLTPSAPAGHQRPAEACSWAGCYLCWTLQRIQRSNNPPPSSLTHTLTDGNTPTSSTNLWLYKLFSSTCTSLSLYLFMSFLGLSELTW